MLLHPVSVPEHNLRLLLVKVIFLASVFEAESGYALSF